MQTNVGKIDKGFRIIAGLGLISLLFILEKPMAYLGLIGAIPLLTAFMGHCPLYRLVGLSTCPVKK
jgi:hypothetical protein